MVVARARLVERGIINHARGGIDVDLVGGEGTVGVPRDGSALFLYELALSHDGLVRIGHSNLFRAAVRLELLGGGLGVARTGRGHGPLVAGGMDKGRRVNGGTLLVAGQEPFNAHDGHELIAGGLNLGGAAGIIGRAADQVRHGGRLDHTPAKRAYNDFERGMRVAVLVAEAAAEGDDAAIERQRRVSFVAALGVMAHAQRCASRSRS